MYKLLIVVALAVACMAEPEASPEAYRGGYGRPYGGHGGYRGGHGGYRGGFGGSYRRGGYGYRHKRSAEAEAEAEAVAAPEAEAEADPAYLYGGAYNVAPYATTYGAAAYAPYSAYTGYGYGYGLTAPAAYYGGGHFIGKREAEAEADPAYLHGGAYNVAPYATTYGAAPIAYTSAAAYSPYSAYTGYGYGYGLNAPAAYYGGAHVIGKREAEPIFLRKVFGRRHGRGGRRGSRRGGLHGYRG